MNYRRKHPKDKVGSDWSHPYVEKGSSKQSNVHTKREAESANKNFYDWGIEENVVDYHR